MKRNETQSNQDSTVSTRQHGAGKYGKVFDARKRRVRGLWERNGTFYAQLTVVGEGTGQKVVRRVRMEDKDGTPVASVADAVKVMAKLKGQRDDETLKLSPKRTPTFGEFADEYIRQLEVMKDAKRPATVRRERNALRLIKAKIGHLRLREISKPVVIGYMTARQEAGVSGRGVNIEVQVIRNVLKEAVVYGHLPTLPLVGLKKLNETTEKKRLLSHSEILSICDTAIAEAPITGQMVSDFIKLMSYAGGRWGETIRLRWQDVDFDRQQIHIGADGLSKSGEARAVDFNPQLAAHLEDMAKRRVPDSQFLFPSRFRTEEEDCASNSFYRTIRDARTKAGVPWFTCHLCRHYFISTAVMSGLDFMTIAAWAGHRDGGVLIGKTYGHLSGEHKKNMAAKLSFGPVIVDGGKAVGL